MSEYVLSALAIDDVDDYAVRCETYSEGAAHFELELVLEFVALATLRAPYRHVSAILPPPFRVRTFRSDLIYYDNEARPLRIPRVVHGSRDLSTLRPEPNAE